MKLKDNEALLEYLNVLAKKASDRGQKEVANLIEHSAGFYFGSETEFLGEA